MLVGQNNPELWTGIAWNALWMAPLAAVALGLMLWRGWLGPRGLDRAPGREAGLGPLDVLAGFGIYLAATSLLAAPLLHQIGLAGDQLMPIEQGARMLLLQVLGQGSAAAYLLVRASQAERGVRNLGILPRRPLRDLFLGLGGLGLTLPVIFAVMLLMRVVGELVGDPAPERQHETLNVIAQAGPGARLLLLLAVVVFAPLLEEIMYRGLIQTSLLPALGDQRWLVVLVAAGFFSLVHLGGVPWHALPALAILGVLFGWLYERTGSLWPGIVAHAGFNALNSFLVVGGVA